MTAKETGSPVSWLSMVSQFQNTSKVSGIWNIISPNNFWSLLFRRRAQWVARCPPCSAHQTLFLNHCLIFYFLMASPAKQRLPNCVLTNKEDPLGIEHLNQSLKRLRLLRSVSWCSHVCRGARGKFRLYKSRYWYERSKHGPDGGKT